MAREMPFPKGAPAPLLGGPGFLLLPHDPCRAVGMLPHVRRVLRALGGDVAIACAPEVQPWLPTLPVDEVLVWRTDSGELDGWCHETAEQRRGWAWSLDEDPDPGALAAFAWLGGERRIAADLPAYGRVANVRLPRPASDEGAGRDGFASRLGLDLPDFEPVARERGGSVVLELPDTADKKEVRRWIDLAATLSERQPLVVVHFDLLPQGMGEALRALGNRLSLLRLSRADDVLRLGGEVRAWVGRVGPAGILASQAGCGLVLLEKDREPALEIGPRAIRADGRAVFARRRNPSPSEVLSAVLDLPASGM